MPLVFGNGISTITGKPEPSMEEKVLLGKAVFNHIKNNLFPPPGKNLHQGMPQSPEGNPAQFIDRSRPDYQPSLFAAPQANITLGQSGAWKTPLGKFLKFMSINPKAPMAEITKKTKLTKYQVETLRVLIKGNK